MKKLNMKKVALVVALTLPAIAMAAGTQSGTTAPAFDDLLTEVRGLLVGAPGKIIAILAFGLAMFNVVKQNFIAGAGAFIGALLMAFAGDVIDTIFTAGV